jgi:hypothetical protein
MLQARRDAAIHRDKGGRFRVRWHFSFERYQGSDNIGLGPLKVFNDDRLA